MFLLFFYLERSLFFLELMSGSVAVGVLLQVCVYSLQNESGTWSLVVRRARVTILVMQIDGGCPGVDGWPRVVGA